MTNLEAVATLLHERGSASAHVTKLHADALRVLSTCEAPDAAQGALRTSYLLERADATLRFGVPAFRCT